MPPQIVSVTAGSHPLNTLAQPIEHGAAILQEQRLTSQFFIARHHNLPGAREILALPANPTPFREHEEDENGQNAYGQYDGPGKEPQRLVAANRYAGCRAKQNICKYQYRKSPFVPEIVLGDSAKHRLQQLHADNKHGHGQHRLQEGKGVDIANILKAIQTERPREESNGENHRETGEQIGRNRDKA